MTAPNQTAALLELIARAFNQIEGKADKLAFTMAVKTCCRDLNISINGPKPKVDAVAK